MPDVRFARLGPTKSFDVNDQAQHPSNHNLAGLPVPEQAQYAIDSALEGPMERWNALKAGVERCPMLLSTQSAAEDATTLAGQLQALSARIDNAHRDAKEPFLEAGRVCDNRKNALSSQVWKARKAIQERITAFQVRETRRIEAERAALREREAADPEPGWSPSQQSTVKATKIRSVEGAQATLTAAVDIEIEDVTKIPLRYLNRPKVLAALRSEILPDVKKGDKVEGVKVHEGATTRVTK